MSIQEQENEKVQDSGSSASASVSATAEVPRLSAEEVRPAALEIIQTLLSQLEFRAEANETVENGNLRIRLKCEDAGRLIGRGGNSLSSLQFLLNRILSRRQPGAPRIYLDVEGFREQLDEDVVRRAEAAAEQVRRWGQSLELAPMNAYERRVIHQHFANDPDIRVESVGEERGDSASSAGVLKKMILRPKA